MYFSRCITCSPVPVAQLFHLQCIRLPCFECTVFSMRGRMSSQNKNLQNKKWNYTYWIKERCISELLLMRKRLHVFSSFVWDLCSRTSFGNWWKTLNFKRTSSPVDTDVLFGLPVFCKMMESFQASSLFHTQTWILGSLRSSKRTLDTWSGELSKTSFRSNFRDSYSMLRILTIRSCFTSWNASVFTAIPRDSISTRLRINGISWNRYAWCRFSALSFLSRNSLS